MTEGSQAEDPDCFRGGKRPGRAAILAIDAKGGAEANEIAGRTDMLGRHSPAILQEERLVNMPSC